MSKEIVHGVTTLVEDTGLYELWLVDWFFDTQLGNICRILLLPIAVLFLLIASLATRVKKGGSDARQ